MLHSEDAMRPGAPVLWDEVPNNVTVETVFGNVEATDRAFARAAHVVKKNFHIGSVTGVPIEPRAALGHYDAATGRYTLYAGSGGAVRQKNELVAGARHRAGKVARAFARRRRQFRHPQSHLRRVRPGAVGVAKRSAGR